MKSSILLLIILFVKYSRSQIPNISIVFFGSDKSDRQIFNYDSNFDSISKKYYDSSRKSVLIIWGYHLTIENDSSGVIEAYIARNSEFNVLYLDWSIISNTDHVNVFLNLKDVSATVYIMIKKLIKDGFDIKNTHIVSFSYGTAIVANVANSLRDIGIILPRITGLDPPGCLGIYALAINLFGIVKLGTHSAFFVDIIHTTAGHLGESENIGHVDFFPNGGSQMPGCDFNTWIDLLFSHPRLSCNHLIAMRYYAESITRNSTNLPFLSGNASMGFYADITTTNRGSTSIRYDLNTNEHSPYSFT